MNSTRSMFQHIGGTKPVDSAGYLDSSENRYLGC